MSRAALSMGLALGLFASGTASADASAPAPSPQALAASCKRGDQAACTALGYHLVSDQAIPPDVGRAFDLWRRGCAAGHLPACLPYGQMLLTGYEPDELRLYIGAFGANQEIKPDRSEGRKVLGRACDRGHAPACDTLGQSMLDDASKREEVCRLFNRACTAGDPGGCWDQVRHCPRPIAVTAASGGNANAGNPSLLGSAFSADRNWLFVVERANAGRPVRAARIDRAGRLTWLGTLPAGRWAVAACGDGRTAWFTNARQLLRADGNAPLRAIPLPAPALVPPVAPGTPKPVVPPHELPPDLVACLSDGGAVVARVIAGGVTDDDYRRHLDRHPEALGSPEVANLQMLQLSVSPYTREREIERGRALAERLAADLRGGKPWAEVVQNAKDRWYSTQVDQTRWLPLDNPPPGAPPPGVFKLKPGQILGPVVELEPARYGRFPRRHKGTLKIWQLTSREPARMPTGNEALAEARSKLRPRVIEVLIAAPAGTVERRRFALFSRWDSEGQIGPLVPLDGGGFALLGDDRQIWKAGHWSTESPLLAALGHAHVLDAVRDGQRVVVLTDARVRAIGLDGKLLSEAPPSQVAAGGFHPRQIGFAGSDGLLLYSPGSPQVGVLALDGELAFRWVDQLAIDVDRPAVFADGGLWLLTRDGDTAIAYQKRQLTEYRLKTR